MMLTSKTKCVFLILAVTAAIATQQTAASATATPTNYEVQTSVPSKITHHELRHLDINNRQANPPSTCPRTCVAGHSLSPRQTATEAESAAQARIIDMLQGGTTAELGQRRQRRRHAVWSMMGKWGLSCIVPVAALRGGAAGAWRVVDPERRRERQAVRNVLLYYPNLIGYARLVLVLTSYYLAEINWRASSCFYLLAFAGDAVDGHVARRFNQASRFGGVLDMVTDRCSTAGLLLVLSRLYDRKHAFVFLCLMFVDLFSHWMHTTSVLNQHHKANTTLRRRNLLIRTYYDNLVFFGFCCVGAELFYILLYLLHFVSAESRAFGALHKACYYVCLPACALKQLVNLAQIGSAARTLALEELDSQPKDR